MGGSVSKANNNDQLVDNLLKDQYLKTPHIQQVFRAVDRGLYFPSSTRAHAYDDTAWRSGNIHLSAAGVYSEVMEHLELGPGMSFLNLGSGTGYLSTMAGLLLGPYGLNYGVELNKDVIQFAYKRLEKFKWTSEAVDEYEFCEPKFFEGNCLLLGSENRLFDRLYCGAACPLNFVNYMKNLIKVGGILVMPLDEVLVKVKRTSETTWEKQPITPVNFANMILPSSCDSSTPLILLTNPEPLSLQAICRSAIRQTLREIVREEHPKLKMHRIRKLRIPFHEDGSPDDPDPDGDGDGVSEYPDPDPDPGPDPGPDPDPDPKHIVRMFLLEKLGVPPTRRLGTRKQIDDDDDDDSSENGVSSSSSEISSSSSNSEDDEEVVSVEKRDDKKKLGESSMPPMSLSPPIPRPSSGALRGVHLRMKRKKAHQSSDSGTDVEEMEVDTTSVGKGLCGNKTDNGKGLKLNVADSPGNGNGNKKKNGASCSNSVSLRKSARNGNGEEDEYGMRECPPKSGNVHDRRLQNAMMLRKARMLIAAYRKNMCGDQHPCTSSEEGQSDEEDHRQEPTNVFPSYSILMRDKIRALPLPPSIQSYLNYYRTF